MAELWLSTIREALSQGDVLSEFLFPVSDSLRVGLERKQVSGNRDVWVETMTPALFKGKRHALVHAKVFPAGALVVSHDCELDKQKPRVLVAPIESLDIKEPQIRQKILDRASPAAFPLPGLPGVGDCYADLRYIVSVSRKEVDKLAITASLSDTGANLLRQHLFAFFTRLQDASPPSG